jgi:hypothetical protein
MFGRIVRDAAGTLLARACNWADGEAGFPTAPKRGPGIPPPDGARELFRWLPLPSDSSPADLADCSNGI